LPFAALISCTDNVKKISSSEEHAKIVKEIQNILNDKYFTIKTDEEFN
jgi:hypothetical protein